MQVNQGRVTDRNGKILPYEDSITAMESATFHHHVVMRDLAVGIVPEVAPGCFEVAAYVHFARAHAAERDLGGI